MGILDKQDLSLQVLTNIDKIFDKNANNIFPNENAGNVKADFFLNLHGATGISGLIKMYLLIQLIK